MTRKGVFGIAVVWPAVCVRAVKVTGVVNGASACWTGGDCTRGGSNGCGVADRLPSRLKVRGLMERGVMLMSMIVIGFLTAGEIVEICNEHHPA